MDLSNLITNNKRFDRAPKSVDDFYQKKHATYSKFGAIALLSTLLKGGGPA